MKHLLLATLLMTAPLAMAQGDDRGKANPHNLNVTTGFNRGGFTFGAGYEHMFDGSTGAGGHFRMFSKDKDRGLAGLILIGADLSHHFYKKSWDLAFTPSLNMIMIDSAVAGGDDATTFGPGLAITLTWAMTERFALGFDYSNYWAWFDKDYQGLNVNDMSVRFRIGF